MDTLGRISYPNILISGENTPAAKFFINSLRFSTHGEFYLDKYFSKNLIYNYAHLHDITDQSLQFSYILNFKQNFFTFRESTIEQHYITRDITTHNKSNNIHYVDYIIDHTGNLEYICSFTLSGKPIHLPVHINDYLGINISHFQNLNAGTIITLNLSSMKTGAITCSINQYFSHWLTYRAIGINIPLLIIQTFLGRAIKTVPMVDVSDISFDNKTPEYNIHESIEFWFDLDETLTCRGKPIPETILLLKKIYNTKHYINLITRHIYDVYDTLSKIKIKPNLFNKIYVIRKNQKKSEFVTGNSIFIDNEFPERLDVRKNNKCLVMDIDQIDFINTFKNTKLEQL